MMPREREPWRAGLVVVGIVAWLATGCGTRIESQEREQSNLKPLAIMYGQFIGQHRGQPPKNEEEFKQYVRSQSPDALASFGVSDPDAIFVSSRDGQPYVVHYGNAARTGPPGPGGQPVIAYEQTGVGGDRFVASSIGAIEEVDEERFRELVPDAAP